MQSTLSNWRRYCYNQGIFGVWQYTCAAVMVTQALHAGNQRTACPRAEEKPAQRQAQGVMKRSVRNQSQIWKVSQRCGGTDRAVGAAHSSYPGRETSACAVLVLCTQGITP